MTNTPPPIPDLSPALPYAMPAVESRDVSHLKLLSIFYFVLGPIAMVFGLFPIVYIVVGYMIYSGGFPANNTGNGANADPKTFGLIFMALGTVLVCLAWAVGLASLFTGWQLRKRQRWTLCVVLAGALCLFVPLGTVLGIFSIIVLMRPSVRPLFI
jgi:hypothetical protein